MVAQWAVGAAARPQAKWLLQHGDLRSARRIAFEPRYPAGQALTRGTDVRRQEWPADHRYVRSIAQFEHGRLFGRRLRLLVREWRARLSCLRSHCGWRSAIHVPACDPWI